MSPKYQAAKTPPAPPCLFSFPSGDVNLLVQNSADLTTPLSVAASSTALSLASPVWKKFLFPPWAPCSNSSVTQIDCTSDSTLALTILLNIAHLKFRLIPRTLTYETLLQVAILCDQYSCADLVQPWLESWMHLESTVSMEEGNEGWLFIAWVFGRETTFEELAKKLVLEIRTNKEGECLLKNGDVIPEPMPNGIIESMLAMRAETIAQLFRLPHAWLTRFERSKKPLCIRAHEAEACDALIYGSLARGLQKASLWPLERPADIHLSVEELTDVLKNIRIFFMPEPRGKDFNFGHSSCNMVNLRVGVTRVLENVGSPVLDCHIVHMKARKGEEGK